MMKFLYCEIVYQNYRWWGEGFGRGGVRGFCANFAPSCHNYQRGRSPSTEEEGGQRIHSQVLGQEES